MQRSGDVVDAQVASEVGALRLSAAAALAFAVLAVVWGLAAASAVILFDGVYSLLGFVLAALSVRASRLVEAGPTARYPFGREALAPLMVGVQGLVLLGTFGYAVVDAVLVILEGGSETAIGAALVYSVVTTVAAVAVRMLLAPRQHGSDLVAAEVAQWDAAIVLGALMVVGFGLAFVLQSTSLARLAPYVDPVLVMLAAVVILPTPVRMLRQAFRELLEAAPGPEVTGPVHEAVGRVRADLGLPEPTMRIGKLGRKVYAELDFLVEESGGWTVGDADRIRRRLLDDLAVPGRLLWLNVELHVDPTWDR